jgi:hypothetical protein
MDSMTSGNDSSFNVAIYLFITLLIKESGE